MTEGAAASRPRSLLRWLLVGRAVIVLALGLSLLVSGPDHPILGNLLATFWLVGALLTLRWARNHRDHEKSGLAVVAGIAGVTAGVIGLSRFLIEDALSLDAAFTLLGITAVAVGSLRVFGAFRDSDDDNPRTVERLVLGISEIGIGVVWIVVDDLSGPVSAAAGIWALAGGVVMLLDALQLRADRDRP